MLAGASLVAVPIIIHLLHRLRTRKVRWAAMDFLLESEKRNRRRLLFEQLLLLMLRCLLILLLVTILARPRLGRDLADLLSTGQSTEHFVLLDDSYSMGEQLGQQVVFERALQIVGEIADRAVQAGGSHHLTVLRGSNPGGPPDFASLRLDASTVSRLRSLPGQWQPTWLTFATQSTTRQLKRHVSQSAATRKIVYLVSDFRRQDWQSSGLAAGLKDLADEASIRLVDVAGPPTANAGVEQIEAGLSSLAVGVSFPVRVRVRNHSEQPMNNVAVQPLVDSRPLPSRVIDNIEARGTGELEIQVRFDEAGPHEVAFQLAEDSLTADNVRRLAINLSEQNPVLIVDDSLDRHASRYLALALAPGGDVRTGLDPQVHSSDRITSASLTGYSAIYLADVSSLSPAATATLRQYVEQGGGLAIFASDRLDPQQAAAWLKDDDGLLHIDLGPPVDLQTEQRSDRWKVALEHPVFAVFAGDRNPFLATVDIQKYFSLKSPVQEPAEAIAWLGDDPLAIDVPVGKGRVFLFLSTCGPLWNNWCRNPSFVVSMLELHDHLSESSRDAGDHMVGQPWEERFTLSEYRRRVELQTPGTNGNAGKRLVIEGELDTTGCRIHFEQTNVPGTYVLTKTRNDGTVESTARSYNVQPEEGDLARITPEELRSAMAGIAYDYLDASAFLQSDEQTRFEPRDWLLALFVLLLFCEQCLAWRLSYHWT